MTGCEKADKGDRVVLTMKRTGFVQSLNEDGTADVMWEDGSRATMDLRILSFADPQPWVKVVG